MSELATKHPLYVAMEKSWRMMRDFIAGEETVKEKNVEYLPATDGQLLDWSAERGTDQKGIGQKAYEAYKLRARVPEYTGDAVEILVGLLHQKPATIELPPELEYLRAKASTHGESLNALHQRINVEQISTGRLGLLVDMPATPDPRNPDPYIELYVGESPINWDADVNDQGQHNLNFVVLDESTNVRNGFSWDFEQRYRVLELVANPETGVEYRQGYFTGEDAAYVEEEMRTPMLRGKTLEEIPFTFINTKDLLPPTDKPPLKSLAQLCLGIYLGEADYRFNLYMQAQETLVVIGAIKNTTGAPGEPDAVRVGAGSRIDVDQDGDAKYIGVSAKGLSEQRQAIEADRRRAEVKAGELVQNAGSQMESGTALTTRFGAQTATLNQIANTGAAGLESALRHIARWKGADETKIKVTPNLEFINFTLDGQNFLQIMQAKALGFPISLESLHALAADRGITVMDYITEIARLKAEKKLIEEIGGQLVAPAKDPEQGANPANKEKAAKGRTRNRIN